MIIASLYWGICFVCWAYALRRGGAAAWWAFACFVAMTAGSILALRSEYGLSVALGQYNGFNAPLFLVDAAYFIGLTAIAVRCDRYWPIWSAGFALTCVSTHLGPLLDGTSDPKIYRGLASFWQLPILITMVVGIAKDLARARADNSEKTSGASRVPNNRHETRLDNATLRRKKEAHDLHEAASSKARAEYA